MSGFCSLKMSLRTTWWFLHFLPITVKIKHELIERAVRRTYCVRLIDCHDGSDIFEANCALDILCLFLFYPISAYESASIMLNQMSP